MEKLSFTDKILFGVVQVFSLVFLIIIYFFVFCWNLLEMDRRKDYNEER